MRVLTDEKSLGIPTAKPAMSELITLSGTYQLRWSAVVDLFPYLGKRARSLAEPSPTLEYSVDY